MQTPQLPPPPPPYSLLPASYFEPKPQDYYTYALGQWQKKSPTVTATSNNTTPSRQQPLNGSFYLLSWNIDVLIGFGEERMAAGLKYLDTVIAKIHPGIPIILFLQEMSVSDLRMIQATPWIQEHFYITDLNAKSWKSPVYGTTMLVDKKLKIARLFRTPFYSRFERDGFFVDIELAETDKVLRLCNVHLESLVADPPIRPKQLEQAAKYMHGEEVHAAALAGDCNAIQPFDRTLHTENELNDAYLKLGGKEDMEEGYTWGQQVPQAMRDRFGCSRLDKVMFCGKLEVKSLVKIGEGIIVEDEEVRKRMVEQGMVEYVTDHIGLMAEMKVIGCSLAGS